MPKAVKIAPMTPGIRKLREWERYTVSPNEPHTDCLKCGSFVQTREECDPSAVCDLCAQGLVRDVLPVLIAEVRDLREGMK
jgi:hypothetical protein